MILRDTLSKMLPFPQATGPHRIFYLIIILLDDDPLLVPILSIFPSQKLDPGFLFTGFVFPLKLIEH